MSWVRHHDRYADGYLADAILACGCRARTLNI
jgi:hypothetical protein